MPVSALLLCFLFCFQPCTYARLSHVVREERVRHGGWSWPKFPVWTPRDLGLQHITLTGVLHVGDKPTIVTLLTFLKIWHGRVTVYDPTTVSLENNHWPHHTSPNYIVFGTQPIFVLQEATMSVQHRRDISQNHSHVLELVQPHAAGWGPSEDGQPWVLRGQTPLTEHFEYYFCVNDWHYTALITQEMTELPPYIEPHSATPTVYAIVKPLFTYDPGQAIKVIYFNAEIYAQLGFNSTILYERGTYMRHLQNHAATATQMQRGVLKLMRWDHGTSMVPLGTRETFPGFNEYEVYIVEFDQTVLFNHALTAMYGMNTYIFLADNDEVLAIVPQVPAPAIHNLLMHGCLKTTPRASSFVVYRWKFPKCTMTQADAFTDCVRSHMLNDDKEDGGVVGKVLHFADEVHSVYMHWPKAYMAPSSWGMNVDKDCAFIAHFDTHFDTLDWDGVFENAA